MTTFINGDVVVAQVEAQGLRLNVDYEVVDMDVRALPFGTFVTYLLQPVGGTPAERVQVQNGHLLLRRKPKE